MSKSQLLKKNDQQITPPQSFANSPLTPPSTDEKTSKQISQVIKLFKAREAGQNIEEHPWTEFQLTQGDYQEIECQIGQDKELLGYVRNKIRYDYFEESCRLAVRMPTHVHELFIGKIEDDIRSQLKTIRDGSDSAALFAQKIIPIRSTTITFPLSTKSKHDPDTSFEHEDAEYPGVVVEVGYSQKSKRLGRLAEDYLLDSDANIQVVVGLDIEYGKNKESSRKATLSVWRTHLVEIVGGHELRVIQETADEAFRDDFGTPTNHPGLRLQLSDFACKQLTRDVGDREISISTRQLCQYLAAAERRIQGRTGLISDPMLPNIKKRKRSETPPESIASDTEAWYVEREERAAKRVDKDDSDYENT